MIDTRTISLKDQVERFLFDEADLLDRWKLSEWEKLLTNDARYLVPPIGYPAAETSESATTLFIVADNRDMIAARIERLEGRSAFSEIPRSVIRHMIGNIRILSDEDGELDVRSNFTIHRVRRANVTSYIGQYTHRLVRDGASFKIRLKSVLLDIDVLKGQGGLSIIL
jgi:p-cumate 2,3-dioxygenase beta subunit